MTHWIVIAVALLLTSCGARAVPLPDPPAATARDGIATLTLTATRGAGGRDTFAFQGSDEPPTIRVSPGDVLEIRYVNALPTVRNASTPQMPMNMSNLHFHGLSVSPERPQDDVLDMMAMPGEALDYTVKIPIDHLPGLDWYHTHPHGESHQQVLDGMSGALVIEGMERYVPEVRTLRERVLVIRAADIARDRNARTLLARMDVERTACGASHDEVDRLFTVNGVLRPEIAIQPGERQFWRIVNAAADRYLDVDMSGDRFDVVAFDGLPIAYHEPARPVRAATHVLLPPAGRVEAIVSGRPNGTRSALRTRCVDTGRDGDPNPGMVLADVAPANAALPSKPSSAFASQAPALYKVVDLEQVKRGPPSFVATFSEDRNGFYINRQKFAPDAPPMVRAKVGGYEHWRILNDSGELHPMHIHQVHFLAFLENGRPLPDPAWLDTVNVPVGGSVDVIMDFTDPVIRGMSLFHCHLLNHEDKGMMAKILFE